MEGIITKIEIISPDSEWEAKRKQKEELTQLRKEATDPNVIADIDRMLRELEGRIIIPN